MRTCIEAIVLRAAAFQVIKLMVTSDLPAIQTLATMYIISYALQLLNCAYVSANL